MIQRPKEFEQFPFIAEMIVNEDSIPEYLRNAKFKDFKYLTSEEVLFLRKLNGHKMTYRIHFHWISIHIAKLIVLLGTLTLEIYFFGFYITLMSLIPLTLALSCIGFLLYMVRER